jgi:delta8-fatty-acid desaturase
VRHYRIGRKPSGPWTNLTPPIRGGIHHKLEDLGANDKSSGDILNADITSISDCPGKNEKAAYPDLSLNVRQRSPGCSQSPAHAPVPIRGAPKEQQSPSEYTDWAVRKGIKQDIEDYPSLDPAVQLRIAHKYRLLHQKVRDQGLYECRLLEYGKEMIRYVGLLLLFTLALRHGWYMTSAVFLGLFWVRLKLFQTLDIMLTSMRSIKSCSPLTMLDISPSPTILSRIRSLASSSLTSVAVYPLGGGRAATMFIISSRIILSV